MNPAIIILEYTSPICLYGESECHVPTVADLFDRIIQQSSRMFSISTDLHSEIVRAHFPRRNTIGRQKCHTHWIVTPGDKEKAQRLGHEALTEAILRLLCIGDMVRELREGVLKVTAKWIQTWNESVPFPKALLQYRLQKCSTVPELDC
uniref:Uncharacterized protein n=1 Tax=Neogobius melanostomus TaxID=47308 RepID=A0A8C6TVD2_9GOBI